MCFTVSTTLTHTDHRARTGALAVTRLVAVWLAVAVAISTDGPPFIPEGRAT